MIQTSSIKHQWLTPVVVLFCPLLLLSPLASYSSDETYDGDKVAREYACLRESEEILGDVWKGQRFECGFEGALWHENLKLRINQCMQAYDNRQLADTHFQERQLREKKLDACWTQKTAPTNPDNQVKVPESCKDPEAKYVPVRSSKHSEEIFGEKVHTPISGGLIKYDYNLDEIEDYLFFEVSKLNAKESYYDRKQEDQFILCMSNKGAYQRHKTDIYFARYPLTHTTTTLGQFGSSLVIDMEHFEVNLGSSYRSTRYRYSTKLGRFEIVDDSDSASSLDEKKPIFAPRSLDILPKN